MGYGMHAATPCVTRYNSSLVLNMHLNPKPTPNPDPNPDANPNLHSDLYPDPDPDPNPILAPRRRAVRCVAVASYCLLSREETKRLHRFR